MLQGVLSQSTCKLPASPRRWSAATTPLPLPSHEPHVLRRVMLGASSLCPLTLCSALKLKRRPQSEDIIKGYDSGGPSSAHTCEGGTQALLQAKVLEMSVPILSYKDQHPAKVERAQTLKTAGPCFKHCCAGHLTLHESIGAIHLLERQFLQVMMPNSQDHPEGQGS